MNRLKNLTTNNCSHLLIKHLYERILDQIWSLFQGHSAVKSYILKGKSDTKMQLGNVLLILLGRSSHDLIYIMHGSHWL